MIRHQATSMALGHRVEARTLNRRRAGASCVDRSTTYTCATLSVYNEALYLRSYRDHVRDDERRKRVELPYLTAASNERTHIETREDRVAVHRAEWVIQGCEDEIGRVYDKLPRGGR